jgi:hypothetical protein
MISIIVEPGKVDPKQSDFRKKGKMIYITPRNKKGQLLGPGYSRKFKLKAGEKEYDIEFKDLLDGTYQIEVPEKETEEIKEKGLDVDITFRKNLIWRRKL